MAEICILFRAQENAENTYDLQSSLDSELTTLLLIDDYEIGLDLDFQGNRLRFAT